MKRLSIQLVVAAMALHSGIWGCSGLGSVGTSPQPMHAADQGSTGTLPRDANDELPPSEDSKEAPAFNEGAVAIERTAGSGIGPQAVALNDGIPGVRQGNEGQVVEKAASYLIHVSNVEGVVDQASADEGDSECFIQSAEGDLLPIPPLFPPGAPFSPDYARPVVKMLGSQDPDPNFPHIYFVDRCGRTLVTYPYLKFPEGKFDPNATCDHFVEIWASFETGDPKTTYQSSRLKISCPEGGLYPQSLVLEKITPPSIRLNRVLVRKLIP